MKRSELEFKYEQLSTLDREVDGLEAYLEEQEDHAYGKQSYYPEVELAKTTAKRDKLRQELRQFESNPGNETGRALARHTEWGHRGVLLFSVVYFLSIFSEAELVKVPILAVEMRFRTATLVLLASYGIQTLFLRAAVNNAVRSEIMMGMSMVTPNDEVASIWTLLEFFLIATIATGLATFFKCWSVPIVGIFVAPLWIYRSKLMWRARHKFHPGRSSPESNQEIFPDEKTWVEGKTKHSCRVAIAGVCLLVGTFILFGERIIPHRYADPPATSQQPERDE